MILRVTVIPKYSKIAIPCSIQKALEQGRLHPVFHISPGMEFQLHLAILEVPMELVEEKLEMAPVGSSFFLRNHGKPLGKELQLKISF